MKTLKWSAIRWALVVFVALVMSVVALGASSRKPALTKARTAKTAGTGTTKVSPVIFARDIGNARSISAMPLDPKSVAEDRTAFALLEAFTHEAEADYHSGDLAGAEAACFQAFSAAPVMGGQKQQLPYVDLLLGRIYLKGGQYAKALPRLQRAQLHPVTSGIDLDLALAYVRLGDYDNASRFYSDQSILRYLSDGEGVLPQELPGTDSSNYALEASILFARGLDTHFEARDDEALVDFQAAHASCPGQVPWLNRLPLRPHSERGAAVYTEATPLYERAVTGRGFISKEATRRLIGIRAHAGPTQPSKPLIPSKPMTQ